MYRRLRLKAGSGKSTLVKFIVSALELDPELDVCYVAFTGKAANVLTQKGCPNATTAHKLLYYAKPTPSGKYIFTPRKKLEGFYKLIIVDEVSMLPKDMWDLLLTHRVPIIACGDPAQLPPVDSTTDNHVLDHPHIFLDEIMRQAQDSEIIRLSMWIREGKPLNTFPCQKEHVQVINKHEVVSGMYDWADQILCSTNKNREAINNIVRSQKGYGPEPQIGDKVISLKNHWNTVSDNGSWFLTNGSIGTISYLNKEYIQYPFYICENTIPIIRTDIALEDEDGFSNLPIDYQMLTKGVQSLTPQQMFKIGKKEFEYPIDFSYAYAITTWKAQGSEWDRVLGFEERFPYESDTHKRFLYTMITRASKKLVIVKK